MKKIILLGAPGAGKGTLAIKMKEKYGILHVSTGDILRENIRNKTELGIKAKDLIDKGQLVPDELVVEIIKDRLSKEDAKNGVILDGFPRNIKQAEILDSFYDIDVVINMIADEKVILERLTGRRVCKCGGTFNVKYLNGSDICSICGEKLYTRDDDKEEVILDRLKVYNSSTAPLIDHYTKQNKVVDVDANQDSELVLFEVGKLLND